MFIFDNDNDNVIYKKDIDIYQLYIIYVITTYLSLICLILLNLKNHTKKEIIKMLIILPLFQIYFLIGVLIFSPIFLILICQYIYFNIHHIFRYNSFFIILPIDIFVRNKLLN